MGVPIGGPINTSDYNNIPNLDIGVSPPYQDIDATCPEGSIEEVDADGFAVCVDTDSYTPTIEDEISESCDVNGAVDESPSGYENEPVHHETNQEKSASKQLINDAYGFVDADITPEERITLNALVDYADANHDGNISEGEFIAVYQNSIGTTSDGYMLADSQTYSDAARYLENRGLNPQQGYGVWRNLGLLVQDIYGYTPEDRENRIVISDAAINQINQIDTADNSPELEAHTAETDSSLSTAETHNLDDDNITVYDVIESEMSTDDEISENSPPASPQARKMMSEFRAAGMITTDNDSDEHGSVPENETSILRRRR